MGIYEDLEVKKIVNACGAKTTLSGIIMSQAVIDAMADASKAFVDMDYLQAKASQVISEVTGAEAGIVTTGAAAALSLATAACVTGLDIAKMEKLPDTSQMKNEVIIPRNHRNVFDHAIRAAGVKLVEVGLFGRGVSVGVRGVEDWEIESAINDRTAAIAYFSKPQAVPSLEAVIRVGKRNHVPVIVDAAGEVPPASNLKRFIAMGADAVTFSGGKGIRGPQATGILCGKRDLIMAAALQMLDMDTRFETWNPPPQFIDKSRLPGMPQNGFGRGFKVGKEEIVALIVALRLFARADHDAETRDLERKAKYLHERLEKLEGIKSTYLPVSPTKSTPTVEIKFLRAHTLQDMVAIVSQLKSSNPPVYLYERSIDDMILSANPFNLSDADLDIIVKTVGGILMASKQAPESLPERQVAR
jgi:D-glucosaminate-6-phosphate ammonia-lyase